MHLVLVCNKVSADWNAFITIGFLIISKSVINRFTPMNREYIVLDISQFIQVAYYTVMCA